MVYRAKRSFDRTLLGAVAASLAVHVLLLGALCLLARTDGGGSIPLSAAVAMEVDLVAPTARVRQSHGDIALPPPAPVPPQARPAPAFDAPPAKTVARDEAGIGSAASADTKTDADQVAGKAYATIDPAAGDDYRRALLDHIMIYRRPPARAAGEDRGGTVMVHFSVTRGGDVQELMIAGSSGNPDLDDEAIATIWRARPMPKIPSALPDRVSVTLPVTFMVGRAQAPG